MKHYFIILIMLIALPFNIFSQKNDYMSKEVWSYANERKTGYLYYDKSNTEEPTGNRFDFDEKGTMIVQQIDQGCIYFLNGDYHAIDQVVRISSDIRSGLSNANAGYILFAVGDDITYMAYNGEIKFAIQPYQFIEGVIFKSFMYFSEVLFFTDDDNRLHCVLHPSLDQETNKANYRDPEQTKMLFAKDAQVDLQGLSMDDKGVLYLNGTKVYWHGIQINKYKYQIVDSDHINLSDGKVGTLVSTVTNSDEIGESIAIHPSGDIYFLRFSESQNKHILYKIENTWDPVYRANWYKIQSSKDGARKSRQEASSQKATVNDNNVRIRKQPTLTGTEVGKLQKGNIVTVLEKSAESMKIDTMDAYWYRIKTDTGLEGWSYGAFLDMQR